jgi:hypothetical protein
MKEEKRGERRIHFLFDVCYNIADAFAFLLLLDM